MIVLLETMLRTSLTVIFSGTRQLVYTLVVTFNSETQAPINLTATYNSTTSVLLEWTFPQQPITDINYVVYYESGGVSYNESQERQ